MQHLLVYHITDSRIQSSNLSCHATYSNTTFYMYVPRLLKIALLTSLISFDANLVTWHFLLMQQYTQYLHKQIICHCNRSGNIGTYYRRTRFQSQQKLIGKHFRRGKDYDLDIAPPWIKKNILQCTHSINKTSDGTST